MTTSLPLAGLNIVITRPREQLEPLAQGIAELGGHCVKFPLLEITPLADDEPLRTLLARLPEFDLAIFISPNAVRFGMELIRNSGELPPTLQFATVGLSSAKALHDFGIRIVLTPKQQFDSESLLQLPELQAVAGKKVVIFRGDSGRELLGDTLKLRGAHVEYASCYHRGKPSLDARVLLAAAPDALCVSSSEALRNLCDVMSANDTDHFLGLPLFVPHARIAATAQHMGWRQVITTEAGDNSLLAALIAWAAQKEAYKDERKKH